MARKYKTSPVGETVHPWLNKPDTKFNSDGVFTTGLLLSGAVAEKLAEELTAEAQAAFDAHMEEKVPAKDRKKWEVYVPFERLEDDDGHPTGVIQFDFKQNATLKSRDGEEIKVQIALKDSADNDLKKPIFGGSKVRIRYSPRAIVMTGLKQVGVRLDFAAVQVIELAAGKGGGGGFGAYEGGYVQDGGEPEGNAPDENEAY